MKLLNIILAFFGLHKKPEVAKENEKQTPSRAPGNEPVDPDIKSQVAEEPEKYPSELVNPISTQLINNSMESYVLLREPDRSKQTLGTFTITKNNAVTFTCKTIELPWKNNERKVSCIPDGVYRTIRHRSQSYGECFWVQDVPGRSEILIHHGNYAASINPKTGTPDTKGCILPGEKHADVNADGIPDVTSSVNTMKKLREILPDAFELVIRTKNV